MCRFAIRFWPQPSFLLKKMRFEPPLIEKVVPTFGRRRPFAPPPYWRPHHLRFFNVFILCVCSLPSCLPVLASMGKRRAAFRVHLRYWRRIVFCGIAFLCLRGHWRWTITIKLPQTCCITIRLVKHMVSQQKFNFEQQKPLFLYNYGLAAAVHLRHPLISEGCVFLLILIYL